jgi:tellurite resistance protein TerC
MSGDFLTWTLFGLVVVGLLAVDLLMFSRGANVIGFRRAAVWSGIWTVVGLAFAAVVWALRGGSAGNEYLAGYLIEKSLSIDNLFVFALIFGYFAVPAIHQRRVIFWGIVGAVLLRGVFIFAGAALLDAVHWMIYAFGAFLVLTGIRMARHAEVEIHPERNPVLRLLRRIVPMTDDHHGSRFLVRIDGRRLATPLVAAFVLVAAFDVVFAIDSIPAIFAVTDDTFVVYAANAMSLLGLTALYFLLAGMIQRFEYLHIGLAVILVFIGAKMLLSSVVHIPIGLSLLVIVIALAAAIGASLWRSRSDRTPPHPKPSATAADEPAG